jgi:hypothetical protein
MTRTRSIGVILASSLLAVTALAQEEDAQRYTYATYFHCNVGMEDKADAMMKRNAPILDGLVEDGTILGWGWLAHVIGGRVRRLQTMTAVDLGALLSARQEAIATLYEEENEAGAEFSEICGPHLDYIWNIAHEAR